VLLATQNMGSDSEFEEGRILGHAEEQHRLEIYFHDQLAPDLMALAFSIESIRAQLEADGHPAEPKLREVQDRLSEILAPIRQAILSKIGDGSESQ
jgi:signal transduction histidine kinase